MLSPRTIITGWKLDFKKHCCAEFGDYTQVYQDTVPHNSTNLPCSVSTVVLGPTGNVQGTYKFYNLDTGHHIVAYQFTALPMPQEVIDQVHAIANAQRMPADIIFTDAEGTIIDDDGNDIAPPPPLDKNHRSVDPVDGIYMGLHNPAPPVQEPAADPEPPAVAPPDHYPPDFPVPPAFAGDKNLPDDNYFLPLADPDVEDGMEGNVDAGVDFAGHNAPDAHGAPEDHVAPIPPVANANG